MTDSGAIHLLWQILPASYETAVTMNGPECFATHAWMDRFTLRCLIPLQETVQIYTLPLQTGHFSTENPCIFAKPLIFLCK